MIASLSATPLHFTFDKELSYTMTKTFRLFSSFPLNGSTTQGVFIAKDRGAFRVIGPTETFPKKRGEIDVPVVDLGLDFGSLGFDSVELIELAPLKVVEEMFT
jgi:hypothetical protein